MGWFKARFFGYLLLSISLLAAMFLTSCSYNHRYPYDHHRNYSSRYDAYRLGYHHGFEHGYEDRRAGLDFNFQHDHKFRSGISYDRYTNDQYRAGYIKGYEDGYYGKRH